MILKANVLVLFFSSIGFTRRNYPSNRQSAIGNRQFDFMDFLVIDDDKTFRDATCLLIEEAGHYAEGVESGQKALEWLKEENWDAVLLDLNLGRENGLDV